MKLQHIELGNLTISPANMRAGKKPPDVSDILPSVRARGVFVPLIVRANGASGRFEIVAGRRRYFAACALAEEKGSAEPLPCAVMEAGDDAAALEASLIENVARQDPHEVEQWETMTRLVKEGRSAEEIALVFGLTDRQVAQVLALGNLLPKIRELYRREEIDGPSVRLLTMANKAKQKEWLALFANPETFTPTGHNLKSWLFGGASISTKNALFDLAAYPAEIVTDLFGEDGYFADARAFWEAQNEAIDMRRRTYLEEGWSEVVLLDPNSYFQSWGYEKTPKKKGGKVYITANSRGEVAFHEGYLSRKEARRRATGEGGDERDEKPARSEVTSTLQTYIDLHRHAAVRAELASHPAVALRLMAAHAVSGSYLFSVKPEPQRGGSNAVTESVETSAAETAFDLKRREVLALLGFDPDMPTAIRGYGSHGGEHGTAGLFVRLLGLSDEEVMKVVAIVMGEAIEAGSAVVEAVGLHLKLDMAKVWAADESLFELIRDKEVLSGMVAELAGEAVAAANAREKASAQKAIIRDCLAGTNGREKVENWVPRWMRFPPSAYTDRGGVGSVRRFAEVAALIAPAPQEEGPGGADSEATQPEGGTPDPEVAPEQERQDEALEAAPEQPDAEEPAFAEAA